MLKGIWVSSSSAFEVLFIGTSSDAPVNIEVIELVSEAGFDIPKTMKRDIRAPPKRAMPSIVNSLHILCNIMKFR
ncbi:MAG: hypothetical protein ACE5J7_02910 [Candidatus Aenigmatarchaeota archaeon]